MKSQRRASKTNTEVSNFQVFGSLSVGNSIRNLVLSKEVGGLVVLHVLVRSLNSFVALVEHVAVTAKPVRFENYYIFSDK